ncbi:MAG: hypothetical protein ABI811_03925 [Acidobacteriota bacterium]
MRPGISISPLIRKAILIAFLMMAWQVAAKSARDALFLGVFATTALLPVKGASAVLSILLALGGAALLRRAGPGRLIPMAFLLSGGLHVIQWLLFDSFRQPLAVFIYLHVTAFGPLLLSGFWALTNECLDAREARRSFGQIAGFGTLGAVAGGLIAWGLGKVTSPPGLLLLMAALQFLASAVLFWFARAATTLRAEEEQSFPEIISAAPYLLRLAVFVLLISMSAAALDYLFSVRAVAEYGRGPKLAQFYNLYYAATYAGAFLLQAVASRLWMKRFGPGGTVAVLPAAVMGGSLLSMALPGAAPIIVNRALEQLLRGSFFRSGCELFYTPMPPAEKRVTKPVIDIGMDRLGDGLAQAAMRLMLDLPATVFTQAVLLMTVGLSAAATWLALRLDRSYVTVLERGLARQTVSMDAEDAQDAVTRSVVLQTGTTSITGGEYTGSRGEMRAAQVPIEDPIVLRLAELRSGDTSRVRRAITQAGLPEPVIVAQLIELLSRDEVARPAFETLRGVAPNITGQLVDRLADTTADLKVRRRIPRILASSRSLIAWDGLIRQLNDQSFEIRYRCGRALTEVAERHPEFRPHPDGIFAAVSRELASRATQAAGLASSESQVNPPDRENQRWTHMANLLALVLPPQSVRLAFRALQASDSKLRATALEYLESVLPIGLRRQMAAQFEGATPPPSRAESAPKILAKLEKLAELENLPQESARPLAGDD